MYYQEVQNYFNEKAQSYDDVDEQLYWVFSDEFYKQVLKEELNDFIESREDIKLLDAGAGTGRWTLFFYELFNDKLDISGTLVDISQDMLNEAEKKIEKRNLDDRFSCMNGNIEKMDDIPDEAFDLGLSFYNVLSFVKNPSIALEQINKKLNNSGLYFAVVANTYHALYFSLSTGRLDEIEKIKEESKVRFNDDMPYIHCYTPEELAEVGKKAGFSDTEVVGGPSFLYPGMEETKVHGQSDELQNILSNEETFDKLLETELEYYKNSDITGRANTLLLIAKK